MARYSIGFQKTGISAAGAIVDIAAAASDRVRVLEFGWAVSAVSGTTPVLTVGLSRSTAIGTRTSPTTVLAEEVADAAGTATIATAWSAAPTLATTPLRRLPVNAVGGGIVWTWPDRGGLSLPLSGSLVLSALAVAGTTPSFTLDGYIVVDE